MKKANHDCRNVSYDTCDRNDSVHKKQTIQQKQRKLQNQMGKKKN